MTTSTSPFAMPPNPVLPIVPTPTATNYTTLYVLGGILVVVLDMLIILGINLTHSGDNTTVDSAVIAMLLPALTGLAGFIKGLQVDAKVDVVHAVVNSGLTKRLAEASELAFLQGQLAGIQQQIIVTQQNAANALAIANATAIAHGSAYQPVPRIDPQAAAATATAMVASAVPVVEAPVSVIVPPQPATIAKE